MLNQMKNIYLKSKKKTIDLEHYAGKWVAFIDNKPILWDDNLSLLMQKVKKHHLPKEPSIMLVPRKDEGPYILLLL